MKTQNYWTVEEIEILKNNIDNLTHKELTKFWQKFD